VSLKVDEVKESIYAILSSIAELQEGGGVAFTDIWTNRALDSFMYVTVHVITHQ
jgi:hypothetical protein